MRIGIVYDLVYPYNAGGVERRNYAFASHLRDRHEVTIYGVGWWEDRSANGGSNDADAKQLARCRYIAVTPAMQLYHATGKRRVVAALRFAWGVFFALLRSPDEVWDVSNIPYFSVLAAWLASRVTGARLIVTWHEYWGAYWYEYLGWRGIMGRLIERLALRCSQTVITVSEHTRRRLLEAGCPAARVHLIPNGIALSALGQATPSANGSDLIYVGRLLSHKRVDLLLEAMQYVQSLRPATQLVIVGDGPDRETLEKQAATLGVAANVKFTGRLETEQEVYAQMLSSSVFVSASAREGQGIALIEAWGCGLPAVVTDEPDNAMSSLIDQEFKGRVVASTGEAIGEACLELLDRPRGAQRLREWAAHFDWRALSLELEAIYAEACGRKKAPARPLSDDACRSPI